MYYNLKPGILFNFSLFISSKTSCNLEFCEVQLQAQVFQFDS